MAKKLPMIILTCLIISLYFSSARASCWGIESCCSLQGIDGDTFVLDNGDKVRFADVNTPEIGESGYQLAKDYVTNLVNGKTVYLDIDNLTTVDQYGRFVSVVYFYYNSTHYENLNKAFLDANLAVTYDFSNNDFIPSNWSWYVAKSVVIPQLPMLHFHV